MLDDRGSYGNLTRGNEMTEFLTMVLAVVGWVLIFRWFVQLKSF